MDIDQFETSSHWYKKMKADGFDVPLTLYHTINKLIKEKHIPFQKVYKELLDSGRIKVVNKSVLFDLNAKNQKD